MYSNSSFSDPIIIILISPYVSYVQYVPLSRVVVRILTEFDHIFVDQKADLQNRNEKKKQNKKILQEGKKTGRKKGNE